MASRQETFYRYPDRFFPDTYLVIDIETTGFAPNEHYITQFGYAYVTDRKLGDRGGFLLRIPPGSMTEGAAEVTGLTEEICNTRGLPRDEAIPSIYRFLEAWRAHNQLFVGFNNARFDMPFLEYEFGRHDLSMDFRANELLDVGMMVKAEQIGTYPMVEEGETFSEFHSRLSRYRAYGVKWNLSPYCIQRFGLQPRIDASEELRSHDASSDCILTHWVLEEIRGMRQAQMEKHGHAQSAGS